ncbi:MAG: hypothetical protein OEO71_01060 [Gammaproteobacteria bacterium]|nr:hypothetical protein [Gammaproteobacteria bacterium]
MGSAFAGGLLCRSSLEWNDHTALLASHIPTKTLQRRVAENAAIDHSARKGCFATMRDGEIGS